MRSRIEQCQLLSPDIRLPSSIVDKQRGTGVLLIAASIIAAIRLRGEPIRPSPKLKGVIVESVQLARLVLKELER